jgi:hypothetical protein
MERAPTPKFEIWSAARKGLLELEFAWDLQVGFWSF